MLSGTHRPGLAARVSDALSRRGFETVKLRSPQVANGPEPAYRTELYLDTSRARADDAARRLRAVLGRDSLIGPVTPSIERIAHDAGDPEIVVVIGSRFHGLH